MSWTGMVIEQVELRARPHRWAAVWRPAILVALLAWWSLIATQSWALTDRTVSQISASSAERPGQVESLRFVAALAVIVLLPALLLRLTRPGWVVPGLAVVCGGLVVALARGGGALVDLLALVGVVLASDGLGFLALAGLRCRPAQRLESLVLGAGLGAGLLSLAGLGLGLLGLLSRPVVLPLLAALAAPSVLRWGRALLVRSAAAPARAGARGQSPGWLEVGLLGVTATYLLVGYTMGLAPEVMSDAVRQHLALARLFADEQRVLALPSSELSHWPLHGEVLFTLGIVLHGPVAAKLIHTATGALAVAAVGLVGRRHAGRSAGLVAAALAASLPVAVWEAGTGYVDLFVALYAALALLCLVHWHESGDRRWSLLVGGALGFGIAAKLTFGFTALAFGLALALAGRPGLPLRERVLALLSAAAGGLLTCGPWLVRSMLLTGQVPGLSLLLDALGAREGGAPSSLSNLPGFGLGRDPAALLRLPWELTYNTARFGENGDGFVGVALLLLLPALVLLRPRRFTLALAVLALIPLLLWFYTAQYLRYLLPALVPLAVLLGAGFVRLRDLGRQTFALGRGLLPGLLGVGLLGALLVSAPHYLLTIFAYPGALPTALVLGRERPEAYVARVLPAYAVQQRLDQEVPPGTPVATFGEGWQLYTRAELRTPFNGSAWLLYARTVPQLTGLLRDNGIAYLLVDRNTVPTTWYGALALQPEFLRSYSQVVYAANNAYLYRLQLEGAPALAEPELLQNPRFEEEAHGGPAYWQAFGTPVYEVGGPHAHTGRGAVRATTSSGYYQVVSIRPGRAYQLSFYVRSDQVNAFARLQINWLDADGKILAPKIEVVPVESTYALRTMWAVAPEGAAFANVYVSSHDDAPCWFSDFSLKEAPPPGG